MPWPASNRSSTIASSPRLTRSRRHYGEHSNEHRRWLAQIRLFGPESLNALDRWRMDNDRREQERAQAQERQKREQERHKRSLARAGAREKIAALRAELAMLREKHESLSALVRDTLNTTTDTLCTLADERREQRAEIDDLKLAVARLGASPEA